MLILYIWYITGLYYEQYIFVYEAVTGKSNMILFKTVSFS